MTQTPFCNPPPPPSSPTNLSPQEEKIENYINITNKKRKKNPAPNGFTKNTPSPPSVLFQKPYLERDWFLVILFCDQAFLSSSSLSFACNSIKSAWQWQHKHTLEGQVTKQEHISTFWLITLKTAQLQWTAVVHVCVHVHVYEDIRSTTSGCV